MTREQRVAYTTSWQNTIICTSSTSQAQITGENCVKLTAHFAVAFINESRIEVLICIHIDREMPRLCLTLNKQFSLPLNKTKQTERAIINYDLSDSSQYMACISVCYMLD